MGDMAKPPYYPYGRWRARPNCAISLVGQTTLLLDESECAKRSRKRNGTSEEKEKDKEDATKPEAQTGPNARRLRSATTTKTRSGRTNENYTPPKPTKHNQQGAKRTATTTANPPNK